MSIGGEMEVRLQLLLLLVLTVAGELVSRVGVLNVKASGTVSTIYVRADGTVDPYYAPIQRRGTSYTIVSDMTSDGDGIVVQKSNIVIDGDEHEIHGKGIGTGITIDNVDNVTLKNMDLQKFLVGIRLNASSFNTVSGVTLANNSGDSSEGIQLGQNSDNNTVLGNSITYNGFGVIVLESDNNVISGNEVMNNHGTGIMLNSSFNTEIDANNIVNDSCGIGVYEFCNGTYISANNITENTVLGINIVGGTQIICHNNFLNNTENAETHSSTSIWDDSVEGNYWDSYDGHDSDLDGIGDTAYTVGEDNKDNYPLTGLFHRIYSTISDWYYDGSVHTFTFDIITNSTVEDFHFFGWRIWMDVSKMAEDQNFGFVRMCISHLSLRYILSPYEALIDGSEPYYSNYTLRDNGTHLWMYFSYEYPAHTIIIPEFLQALILPPFMIATLLAFIVYKRKDIKRIN
jgi:parallel beta-helix repeat protein